MFLFINKKPYFWEHKPPAMKKKFKVEDVESFEKFRISFTKRVFDIIFATFALIVLSPILIISIILIKLESRGSIFYISKRVGTGYDIFSFYKLRSMYVGSDLKRTELSELNQYLINRNKNKENIEEVDECPECKGLGKNCSPILHIDGTEICENFYLQKKRMQENNPIFFKIVNDPRITRIGRIIRTLNIDEIPQFFNVLKGDMSIVGNRPLPLYEAEKLTTDQWALRFLAPAGITGLWQVSNRKAAKFTEEERKTLDNRYAITASFWNDLRLIILTIPAVFRKKEVT